LRFGEIPVDDASGAIAGHSLRAGGISLRKGNPISAEMASALKAAGVETVVAARLDPDDVGEDEAALTLAEAAAGPGVRVETPFTGRSNLFAAAAGILLAQRSEIDAVNAVDEAVTIATLPAYKPVVEGEMIATVKIIPYAVSRPTLVRALSEMGEGPAISIAPYGLKRVGVISTTTPALKPTVIAKTVSALRARLDPASASIVAEATCSHAPEPLTRELILQAEADLEVIVVFGASAIADRRDVIPAAIEAAGGHVEHFGMPVDPGNLLLLGSLGGKPVIGAPGCARSPKENGFDWILQRLLAGLPVARADITRLGVGGLLMEIVSRGQPREGGEPGEEG